MLSSRMPSLHTRSSMHLSRSSSTVPSCLEQHAGSNAHTEFHASTARRPGQTQHSSFAGLLALKSPSQVTIECVTGDARGYQLATRASPCLRDSRVVSRSLFSLLQQVLSWWPLSSNRCSEGNAVRAKRPGTLQALGKTADSRLHLAAAERQENEARPWIDVRPSASGWSLAACCPTT